MPAIRWTKSDGGENWASINGYVGDKLRFHIVGERFGSKVVGWDLHAFAYADVKKVIFSDRPTQRDAKLIAQKIIDKENS